MDVSVGVTLSDPSGSARQPPEWLHHVIALLDAAADQLRHEQSVHRTILEAASMVRKQLNPEGAAAPPQKAGGLLAWQERKLRAYIDAHIARSLLVADLCALVRLSNGHFSRAFTNTFGKSPHAYVVTRRVELAARYMLLSEAPLSDIALRCGFSDQPHLCRQFKKITGYTPAAWRRTYDRDDRGDRRRDCATTAVGRAVRDANCG